MMSPRAFLSKPSRWLQTISRHRGTLSPAPNFAYQLCATRKRAADYPDLDLSSWRLALNGAEMVNRRTLDEFARAFEPHGFQKRAFLPVYGLAEASLGATFSTPGQMRHEHIDRRALDEGRALPVAAGDPGSFVLVSVGQALPGHQVRIVDDGGQRCAERRVGNIVVSGPSLMEGYFGDLEATRAARRDGWLWTGDLGYLADGQLFVTGRAKDMIISRGHNHYAEDIERVAEGVEGMRVGGVVAFGVYDQTAARESAVLVCETARRSAEERAPLIEAVSATVLETCGLRIDDVVLVGPGQLPRTSSGKKQRSLCRQIHQRGGFDPATAQQSNV
jgi:acyl-CoA synthetase (AMP-forming)/AMP-acid ligase II